ncbi:hypothetical protein [Neorhizobium tomejilense]|uniref:hypothetical protein n=1 Tax=Neorhizobium tomejilense TaxID=2093828 RepID=UPI003ED0B39E
MEEGQSILPARIDLGRVQSVGETPQIPRGTEAHQYFKTYLGFWKTCDLSSCRRAKACRGFLTEAQYRAKPGYHDSFPPCVGPGGARQQEVLAGMRRLGGADDDEPKYDGRRKTGEEDE